MTNRKKKWCFMGYISARESRFIFNLLSLFFSIFLLCIYPSNIFPSMHPISKYTKFTIFTFNNSSDILGGGSDSYTLAQIKKVLDREKKLSSNHLTVLTGDMIFPSVTTFVDKGKSVIDLLNMIGIDYVALGNHEFDYGKDVLEKRVGESNFSYLTSNILNLTKDRIRNTQEYAVINIEGVKVGIMGLTTEKTQNITKIGKDYYFLPIIQTAKKIVKKMKAEKVDVIVVLSHLSYKEIKNLTQAVEDIHLIIGGHDREIMSIKDNKTYVYTNLKKVKSLSKIDIVIQEKEGFHKKCITIFPSLQRIEISEDKDSEIEKYISACQDRYKSYLNQDLALIVDDIDSSFDAMRTRETVFGDIASDAIREETGADIGFLTSGFFRGDKQYTKNNAFTQRDLAREFPFNDEIVLIEASGQDILDALENGLSRYEKRQGCFPQVSGMDFSFDLSKEAFSRIIDVKVNGKNIILDKFYLLATTDFIAKGGDGYLCFNKNKLEKKETVSFHSCITKHIQKIKNISNTAENRILSINVD